MKKFLLCLIILLSFSVFAADKIQLKALVDFDSSNPSQFFSAEVLEDSLINEEVLPKGSKINCKLLKIKDAKRAKIDTKAYFELINFENNEEIYYFKNKYEAKYAKKVLNKKEIKNIPPKKVIKTAASVVGGAVVEGFSYGVSFVDGVITNEEGNRLKSGAKQVYDDSFLSYVEYGDEIDIKTGDIFYFIVKLIK